MYGSKYGFSLSIRTTGCKHYGLSSAKLSIRIEIFKLFFMGWIDLVHVDNLSMIKVARRYKNGK